MGLSVEVGTLATLLESDPEGAEYMREQFVSLNRSLRTAGLPTHREPESLPPDQRLSFQMFGYSGLHYLRRIAAHLAFGRPLPDPGDDAASDDPLLAAYFADVDHDVGGWLSRLKRRPRPKRDYDHLLFHGDAEGFYLPVDFPKVLFPDASLAIAGGMVGSSQRLLRECERLMTVLGIPRETDPESDELWSAAEQQGEGEGWRRYGVEAFTCVRLRAAVHRSVASGGALYFT